MRWAVFDYNPFYGCDFIVAWFVYRDDAVAEAVRVGGRVVDMWRAKWPQYPDRTSAEIPAEAI